MIEQEKIVDIEKTVIELQSLGLNLKGAILRLPESVIKRHLLFEISKIIKFRSAIDFYYLQNKIARMIDMVIKWEPDRETLRLLEEMGAGVKEIVKYIEREEKS